MPVRLNSGGGGSVTLDVPVTGSTFTATFPANTGTVVTTGSSAAVTQGMLASGVAGNGPAFSAFLGTNQSIPNNVFTKLNIDTETFDTNNSFNTSLFRFTPNVAGYYFFTGASNIAGSDYASLYIFRNSARVKDGIVGAAANAPYGVSVSGLVFLNGTTDFVELFAYQAQGTTRTASGGASLTYFDGFMVRAA